MLGYWEFVRRHDNSVLDELIRQALRALDAPYLAVHGREPGPDYRRWLAAQSPQSEIEVWPGTGHFPHLAHPDRLAARIRGMVSA